MVVGPRFSPDKEVYFEPLLIQYETGLYNQFTVHGRCTIVGKSGSRQRASYDDHTLFLQCNRRDREKKVLFASGTVPQAPGEDVTERLRKDIEDHLEERRIVEEAKAALKPFLSNEQALLFEESLENIS